jgi:hypothetical protein
VEGERASSSGSVLLTPSAAAGTPRRVSGALRPADAVGSSSEFSQVATVVVRDDHNHGASGAPRDHPAGSTHRRAWRRSTPTANGGSTGVVTALVRLAR